MIAVRTLTSVAIVEFDDVAVKISNEGKRELPGKWIKINFNII